MKISVHSLKSLNKHIVKGVMPYMSDFKGTPSPSKDALSNYGKS